MDDAREAGLSAEAISQQEQVRRIHLVEMADGAPFICLNSLIQI
jgi:hypothetical protein